MNSFTIYKEYYDLITLLDEKEQGELLLAISKYMFEDAKSILNDKQQKIFNNLKRPLDKSKEQSKRRTNQNPNENQTISESEPSEEPNDITSNDVNVYVNVNDLEKGEYEGEEPLVTDDVNSLTGITKRVINHLNDKLGSRYNHKTKTTQTKINARLNEGYKLDDFIVVIDKKYKEWIGTEFEKFLCPETLFGTKFEKYFNQKEIIKKTKPIQSKPEWMNKKIEKEEMTKEELKEIEELFKSLEEEQKNV